MAYNVRLSLKMLKVLTSEESSEEAQSRAFLNECKQTLKYWTIFGMLMVFEFHLEFLVRWVPGWYYLKTATILAVTFPHLKINSVVFDKGIVPFLRGIQAKIERQGGLVNVMSIAVYSAPFLLVDIIFPVKMQGVQFAEYIKKSFRIGSTSTSTHFEVVNAHSSNNRWRDESGQLLANGESFDSAVDYHVQSPVLAEMSTDGNEGEGGTNSSVFDISMNMSLEAEKLFGPAPTRPSMSGAVTSPFAFDEEEEEEEEEQSDTGTHSTTTAVTGPSIQLQRQREDTSRRLSSFASHLSRSGANFTPGGGNNATPGSARRASIAALGGRSRSHLYKGKQHQDLGVIALFDVNVRSPPASALRRRDTMSSLKKRESGSRQSLSSAATSSSSFGTAGVNVLGGSTSSSAASLPLQTLSVDDTRRRASPRSSPAPGKDWLTNDENNSRNQPSALLLPLNDTSPLQGRNSVTKRRGSRFRSTDAF